MRNNRIGNAVQRGISGGQKRRVTIGAAIVTMPRILFLDEPTSGLDSRTSREVLSASTYLTPFVPLIFNMTLVYVVYSQERGTTARDSRDCKHTSTELGDICTL